MSSISSSRNTTTGSSNSSSSNSNSNRNGNRNGSDSGGETKSGGKGGGDGGPESKAKDGSNSSSSSSSSSSLLPGGIGRLVVCFVLDTTPPQGGRRQPNALFNTRAWLYYEAGRRRDLDLSALTSEGNFAGAPARGALHAPRRARGAADAQSASVRWWARAARHAAGPAAAEYYGLVTLGALLVPRGPAASHLVMDTVTGDIKTAASTGSFGLSKPEWVGRAKVAAMR